MVIEDGVGIPVKEIMISNVVSVKPDATLKEVSDLMQKQKIGSVVIIDDNKPVGIITERDFATTIVQGSYSSDTKVSDAMSSPVIHVSPNQSVAEVIDHMATNDIRRIPVIENGQVVGIITGTEFLRLFVQATDEEIKKMYQQFLKRIYSKWFKD